MIHPKTVSIEKIIERFDKLFLTEIREVFLQGDGSWSAGVGDIRLDIKSFLRTELSLLISSLEKELKDYASGLHSIDDLEGYETIHNFIKQSRLLIKTLREEE